MRAVSLAVGVLAASYPASASLTPEQQLEQEKSPMEFAKKNYDRLTALPYDLIMSELQDDKNGLLPAKPAPLFDISKSTCWVGEYT